MPSKKYNVYHENCPSRKLLEIISNKWSILIVNKLAKKKYRFLELKREIGGISQKILTQTLKILEKKGFVLREAYAVLPLKVEYSLTLTGKDLNILFKHLTDWAEKYLDKQSS